MLLWGISLPLIAAFLPRTLASLTAPVPMHVPPPVVPEAGPKAESPATRQPLVVAPPAQTLPPITLPDEVVVRAIDALRPSIHACFKRAMDTEVLDVPLKVKLHVEVDANGKITGASTDAPATSLDNCLRRVGYSLTFSNASGRAAVVDVPLFFR